MHVMVVQCMMVTTVAATLKHFISRKSIRASMGWTIVERRTIIAFMPAKPFEARLSPAYREFKEPTTGP